MTSNIPVIQRKTPVTVRFESTLLQIEIFPLNNHEPLTLSSHKPRIAFARKWKQTRMSHLLISVCINISNWTYCYARRIKYTRLGAEDSTPLNNTRVYKHNMVITTLVNQAKNLMLYFYYRSSNRESNSQTIPTYAKGFLDWNNKSTEVYLHLHCA